MPLTMVDAHQHVFWHGRDDAGLVADMNEQSIDLAWLLSWEIPAFEDSPGYHRILNPLNIRPDGTHSGIILRDLLTARDRYPDRFVVGYCPHPAVGNAPALLASAVEMHDVRVCGEWKFRIPLDDPRSLELFRAAGELKLPVILHLDVPYLQIAGKASYQPLWYGGTVENLERALQACPDTVFIGHAPGFWREISGDAATNPDLYPTGEIVPGGKLSGLLDQFPHLHADLSAGSALNALQRDPRHATQFLTRYANRLLFARDYYGDELQAFLKTLALSPSALEKIYRLNANQLLDRSR